MEITLKPYSSEPDSIKTVRGIYRDKPFKLTLDTNCPSQRYIYEVMQHQMYEEETLDRICDVLQPGDVFFDVGAHVGYFSLFAGLMGAKVVAFEPMFDNVRRLLENCPKALIIQRVVSHKSEMVPFHQNLDNDGGHSLWNPAAHPFNKRTADYQNKPQLYQSVTLDDYAYLKPSVIKVDTEGAEFLVMMGAEKVLQQTQLKLVVCECHTMGADQLGGSVDMLIDNMRRAGWNTELKEGKGIENLFFTR